MKKSFTRRKVFFSVLLLVVLILSIVLWWTSREPSRSQVGSNVTEQQLLQDLSTLETKEVQISNPPKVEPISGEQSKRVDMQYAIDFNSRAKNKPFEVQAAMRVWEYLHERHLPYDVTQVHIFYTINMIMSRPAQITVERADYEELLKSLGTQSATQSLSEEERIAKLADLWIAKHHYHSLYVRK